MPGAVQTPVGAVSWPAAIALLTCCRHLSSRFIGIAVQQTLWKPVSVITVRLWLGIRLRWRRYA